ncbi:MAG: 50S ribosomal protein L15 [Chloroflexi bacterium]|nr:50S ribosomal protein L15 [Chloroflexota bacterium]
MRENDLRPAPGAHRQRRRVGRGDSSGRGSYSGRGMKGQKSRTGGGVRRGFEGGQNPFIKRMPHKRGFVNPFRLSYQPVNLGQLNAFPEGTEITPQVLRQAGVLKQLRQPVAVLGHGELTRPLTVHAHKFSAAAREKIEAAGGKVEVLPRPGAAPQASEE